VAPLPYPPLHLANRVGSLAGTPDPWLAYEDLGRRSRREIEGRLPAGWAWRGKRVLDFGCGAGRTLRQFAHEAGAGHFWGCDIDEASIAWLDTHLSPPFAVFVNGQQPPLPRDDASFDLIYAVSVFSHMARGWSAWLLELRRVLTDDGLLVVTFMGEGQARWLTGKAWDEKRTGMAVYGADNPLDDGGPMVLHSPWWIREHWGRAFEILELVPYGFGVDPDDGPPLGQGTVLMRKRPGELTAADLERDSGGTGPLDAARGFVRRYVARSST
jgi:SAM-dependent methyltransferase